MALVPVEDTAVIVNGCTDGGLTITGIDTVPAFSLTLLLPLANSISTKCK